MNSKKQREVSEAMVQQADKQMTIDYFEFLVLLEAAWYGGTILRHSILIKAMNVWYHALNSKDRIRAYEYMRDKLKVGDGTHRRLLARFNPELQFRVSLSNGTMEDVVDCYLFEGEYWTSSFQCCEGEYIQNVEKI